MSLSHHKLPKGQFTWRNTLLNSWEAWLLKTARDEDLFLTCVVSRTMWGRVTKSLQEAAENVESSGTIWVFQSVVMSACLQPVPPNNPVCRELCPMQVYLFLIFPLAFRVLFNFTFHTLFLSLHHSCFLQKSLWNLLRKISWLSWDDATGDVKIDIFFEIGIQRLHRSLWKL